MSYAPLLFVFVALIGSYLLGWTPLLLPLYIFVMSLMTLAMYAKDKSAAINQTWRVSEGTLLALGIMGGWPGAILAQQRYRHKTQKTSFRIQFWMTVILNCAVLAYLHTPQGYGFTTKIVAKLGQVARENISQETAQAVVLQLLRLNG